MPSMLSSSSKPKSNDYIQRTDVNDHLPQLQKLRAYRRADRLVSRVVPDSEVRVIERLLAGDTLRRVEVEQLLEQIDREGIGTREERGEGHARLDGQRADVVLRLLPPHIHSY